MTKREVVLAQNALCALDGARPARLGREALMDQTGTFAESIVSRVETQGLKRLFLGRGWAERWTDSLTVICASFSPRMAAWRWGPCDGDRPQHAERGHQGPAVGHRRIACRGRRLHCRPQTEGATGAQPRGGGPDALTQLREDLEGTTRQLRTELAAHVTDCAKRHETLDLRLSRNEREVTGIKGQLPHINQSLHRIEGKLAALMGKVRL